MGNKINQGFQFISEYIRARENDIWNYGYVYNPQDCGHTQPFIIRIIRPEIPENQLRFTPTNAPAA
jgi:hypothetical protein